MQELINEAINTNGKIADEGFKRIYRIFKTDQTSNQEASKSSLINITDKLTIKKLTHNSEVNTLASSQSITFNENCNVLFGYNGSERVVILEY